MSKKKKIRAEFRKNRQTRARTGDWTRRYERAPADQEDAALGERISGKGELTRKRTVLGEASDEPGATGFGVRLEGLEAGRLHGRVLSVQGLFKGNWNPGYGFTAFALVYLARLNSLLIVPFAFFFSFLLVGGDSMARRVF